MTALRRFGPVGTIALLVALGAGALGAYQARRASIVHTALPTPVDPVATFSIVGYDPETGDLGIAVQSKFFAVGSVVPWARAGVGAVATQSYANTAYGPDGLAQLDAGDDAEAVVNALTEIDDDRALRQLGIVDAQGNAAAFTGDACLAWAGHRVGTHYAAQGNILAGPEVVDAMATTFETTKGDLASRLTAALSAGQAAGGDVRGRQSAALLVVRAGAGYGGNDRYIDLRVDDHPAPIRELRRLMRLREAQLASGEARRALRAGEHADALAAAKRVVTLDPEDANGWMLLARIHVARNEMDAAGEAGRQALVLDPWLKTATLRGLGDTALIERLLESEVFARIWETINSDG
ncbi:MAG: DUF1028 domain-containing protein [Acidobacteria bacterium]|nr:DUF1028 domain-containing protein [Acidobacteriota bacterium]